MITSADLYCMAMESDVAYRLMPELCAALGMAFPPSLPEPDTTKRDALIDAFDSIPIGKPAPVTLALN